MQGRGEFLGNILFLLELIYFQIAKTLYEKSQTVNQVYNCLLTAFINCRIHVVTLQFFVQAEAA